MDEDVEKSIWSRTWERFWPLGALLSITCCAGICVANLTQNVYSYYHPSRALNWQIRESASGAVVFFVLSVWIIYREWMSDEDRPPILSGLFSVIAVCVGVAIELVGIILFLSSRRP
jgi:hypothetical protein